MNLHVNKRMAWPVGIIVTLCGALAFRLGRLFGGEGDIVSDVVGDRGRRRTRNHSYAAKRRREESVPKVKSRKVGRFVKGGHAGEESSKTKRERSDKLMQPFLSKGSDFSPWKTPASTFPHDLKAGLLRLLRLALLGDLEDGRGGGRMLGRRLVGGRVVRDVAPVLLLQVPQNELPQSLDCRGGEKKKGNVASGLKMGGDLSGVPGCAFLSPSCKAASDTLAGFVSA